MDDFSNIMNENFPGSKCEPLKSKYPDDYCSYKVIIDGSLLETAKDVNKWPAGALYLNFFETKRCKFELIQLK